MALPTVQSEPGALSGGMQMRPTDGLLRACVLVGIAALCWAQTTRSAAHSPPSIASVAFSPDGRLIAAGGQGTVTLIEAATGRVLARLSGHAGMVTAIQFSPAGQVLAAAGGLPGRSGEIRLWDVKAHRLRQTLSGHRDALYALAFRPDGKQIAAASYDHNVSVWNLAAPPLPKILKDHTDSVYAVAFSPDGRLIASAAGDRTVKVWDARTGRRLYTLSEATAELYALAFRPDGKQIAAGGADKTLRTWNITPQGGSLAHSALAHDGPILRVAYASDGKSIVTAGEDRRIKRWDAQTLAERMVYPLQPDWPHGLALSPNGRLLAVGRHDGSLAVYDAVTGRLLREPLKALAAKRSDAAPTTSAIPGRRLGDQRQRRPPGTGGATLFPATLSSLSPTGAMRGQTVRFTLHGALISDAVGVYFDDPAITGQIVTPPDPNRGVLRVDVTLGPTARIGLHRVFVQTPHGTTGAVTFAVGDWPEAAQTEPNNTPEAAQQIALPCTIVGAIDQAGDTDCFRFEAQAGEELVFEVVAQPLRSRLQPVLALLDASGRTLAESQPRIGRPDVLLGYRFDRAGIYVLQLRDYENAAGADVHYRLNAGAFPVATAVFPLGIQKGTTAEVQVKGFNLGGSTARVQAPTETFWGRTTDLWMQTPRGPLLYAPRLAVGEDPEVMRTPGSSTLAKAQPVAVPITINGRLWEREDHATRNTRHASLSHYFRFPAQKGRTLILEVTARRLGSPLDSEIEVLDGRGRPVERAVLRAVAQTELVLSDRDSASGGFRLQSWESLRANDYLLAGREVVRVLRLPLGPDEDVSLRTFRGQRLGYFGTTPEFHSVGSPVFKVEVHPPGSIFSPNGYPLTRLYYRNDDGGPLYGKDSYLEFTPPADGDYIVRLTDARGAQGEEFAYRLNIRPPRPDYRIAHSPAHPNLPKGGAALVEISCERYDGFDGPIEVRLESLPPGFTATRTTIEAGENSATLLLTAAPDAVSPTSPSPLLRKEGAAGGDFRVVATASIQGREVVRTIEPESGVRLLTIMPAPDILVSTDRQEVTIRPGGKAAVEARIDRQGDFGARVPIEVRNLPFGVRVLDVGLNGVLVTEQESARRFVLYCEPWVKPQTRPFYVLGNVEGGVANGARPLLLRVEPASRSTSRP